MNQEKEDFVKMLKEVGVTANIVGVDRLTTLLKEIQKKSQRPNGRRIRKSIRSYFGCSRMLRNDNR